MIAEIEIFSRAMRRLSTLRSGLIRVDYIDVDASTDRLQELERPRDAWDLDVIGAVTSLIVDCADFDQIDADECREHLSQCLNAWPIDARLWSMMFRRCPRLSAIFSWMWCGSWISW